MLDFLKKIFGDKKAKDIQPLKPVVEAINREYEKLSSLSEEQLKDKTRIFREKIDAHTKELRAQIDEIHQQLKGNDEDNNTDELYEQIEALNEQLNEQYEEVLDEILPEAFAVVKETCRRFTERKETWTVMGQKVTWEMVPYDVQLMGGIVLHQGKIAEMATGEGKTLVATLPIYLNGLTGRGVHLVTVNDYLAQRDKEWMGEVLKYLGLTVGVILTSMSPDQRKAQYACDVVYGTNNEFGFDYLRDNMASDPDHQVQRIHNFAIVDEVDSVLIDEARTPLIISGQVEVDDHQFNDMKPGIEKLFRLQNNLVAKLCQDAEDMLKDGAGKDAQFEAGKLILRAYRGMPKHKKVMKLLAEPSYKKLQQETEMEFLREKAKNMHIIDDELYFVIDEKNHSIDLTEKGREELAKGSKESKDYFVLTDLGAEISKFENDPTLSNEEKLLRKDKLYAEYSVKSDRIHTIHQLLKAYCLYEKDVEYVITEEGKIAIVDEFTGRVLPGRRYSDGLHQAIEAKENVHVERDTQTLATITLQNYFRMYNKLAGMTGTAETEESEFYDIYKLEVVVIPTNKPISRSDENDAIYKTRREKYNAIIEQIAALQEEGRPVLVGTTSVEVSETISRMLKRRNPPIAHNVLNAKQHQREAEVVASAGQLRGVTIATNMAGRGTDIKLGAGVREKGGLYILGTERHEARRIDRQLRGRAGRQGDPGISKFYLSLEDDLMRLFGSDRMASVLERMGLKEGEVIEHSLITKSVERAQKKVEENNFSIRKRLLEYDNVMNQQREIIYTRRNRALRGERLRDELFKMLDEYVRELVDKYYAEINLQGLNEELLRNLVLDVTITPDDYENLAEEGIINKILESAHQRYQEKEDTLGPDVMRWIEQMQMLNVIDHKWKEHLREMDELKEGIGLRAYGQKDPLLEYKSEAFGMFETLINEIRNDTVIFCFKNTSAAVESLKEKMKQQQMRSRRRMMESKQETTNIGLRGAPAEGSGGAPANAPDPGTEGMKQTPIRVEERVGRNEPCPCGSGKKYKQCHGANA